MARTTAPRIAPKDLADVVVPSGPVAWGDRVVYVAQRVDLGAAKAYSSLWAVPRSGGPARRR